MTINQNVVKGKWLEIKGEIQKEWGKLTGDELDKTKGDLKSITGLLQQRYGQEQTDFTPKVQGIFKKFEEKKEQSVAQLKNALRK